MNMSFYTAAVGAEQQQYRMNVQGNNIANVNTYGFKAQKPTFASLMYGNVTGIDQEQLPRGAGARMAMAGTDFSGSALADTGKPQDYAILGDGFFALYEPESGQVSYTREGAFSLSEFQRPMTEEERAQANAEEGTMTTVYMLSDNRGRFVLSSSGNTIEVTDPEAAQDVGVFDFPNTDGMLRVGDNRYIPVDKNGQLRFGQGEVQRGMLEMSNVDLAEQMVKVIEAQRSFSYALKMVQTSDEIETTANNLRT